MPIKDPSKYPKNWAQLSAQIKQEAGWKCENCQAKHHAIGYRLTNGRFIELPEGQAGDIEAERVEALGFSIIKIVLTTAHLDQNPGNNKRKNLKALCQKCHLDHDRPFNLKKIEKTRRVKKYGKHKTQYSLLLQQKLF